jgi:hypothetical protein
MRKFAQDTTVPIAGTKGDIAAIIGRYGGRLENIDESVSGRVIILFRSNQAPPRYLRVTMSVPIIPADGQAARRKWRALFNDIKFKFVSVDEGIETFDQAFMAWIIGPDGQTLFDKVVELHLLPAGGV